MFNQSSGTQKTSNKAGNIASVIIILVLIGFGYYYRGYIQKLYNRFLVAPCSQPITYRIGSFDNRFGISQDKFKQAIADAAQIWDKASGHQLFEYKDNGDMPISLIYDSRQQATDQLKNLNINVDSTQASYNQLKSAYNSYQSQYQAKKSQYDALLAQYNADKQAYETQVQYYNSRGGAPQDRYQQLKAQGAAVNAEGQQLNSIGAQLNQLADTINALVATLNRIGSELNLDVSAYNKVGADLGEFDEGLYTADGFNKKIDIYQFDNYQTLVRVLAHELGHSLGLEHVSDPQAIMYKLNQSKNAVPTAADLAELKRMCRY